MQSRTLFGLAGVALLVSAIGAPGSANAQRAAAGPPDWPCVQRLIPGLAWGTMWAGPSIDELDRNWWSDPEVGRVVRLAGSRDTRHEDAIGAVRAFVSEVGEDDREERLTLLFAGLFEHISRERTQTIDAILRYSRGQVGRLERVGDIVDELEVLRMDPDADQARIEALENALHWERRVFNDRQSSLRALCQQPYLLEERLSRMVQAIQAAL